ncbi:DEAD/DEAH box helicase family protein [Vibrio metschnikovii]|uniref:DEAD/DEAH box helicase family protein n=2 Tax=Unclassified Bacteria TaxID=49928 RepID=A0AAU6UP64_UNCXX|nr:DEAD/DEAH box helicase family protein [Vibrio metschnikovii]
MLRDWQKDCSRRALTKYQCEHSHFFCQATPGAGKTVLAAEIAKHLLSDNLIDLVLCFSPTLSVADSIKSTFSKTLNCTFNGGLGSIGQSLTYQSIQFLNDEFWRILTKYRVFVVFDEIHHCSGSEMEGANAWGQQVLTKVQGLATYTLALSGTPWRSDSLPIVMAEYSDPDGQLLVDYQYSLKQAIEDKVCRAPKIVLVDNEHLTITSDKEAQSFSSILELLKQTKTSYQSIINNDEAMKYLLGLGCNKLASIRRESPNAGGLVVASSVQHAKRIQKILVTQFHQSTAIVTYRHDEPLTEINAYRHGNTEWIVSVGMISEGTDIPRLQVCCHISSVKTELYFRQVLGRILRVNNDLNQEAWLFTFAEQSLIEYSERIEQDIPETCLFAKIGQNETIHVNGSKIRALQSATSEQSDIDFSTLKWGSSTKNEASVYSSNEPFDELRLGSFKQRVISAFLYD